VTHFTELKIMQTQEKPMTSAMLTLGGRLRTATTLAALAACLAVGALGTARAAGPSIAVRYTGQDLATEEGSQALYARIEAAARAVCPVDDIRDLRAVAAARACRKQAIEQAVRSVDNPKLAAVYAARRWHT
jgi:UrcA family protein